MSDTAFATLKLDPEKVRRALRECAAQVLETMFFISPAEEEPPEEVLPPAHYRARVCFRGDRDGVFSVRVPECMARAVASNFLADDELPVEKVEEVVREFANMLCGSTLSAIAPHATFSLDTPALGSGSDEQGESYHDSLLSECGRMEMSLEFWPVL
jgi:CheY-specific phosphatase CheX